jgi:hypothetical protein
LCLIGLSAILAVAAFALAPIATVNSAEPFTLNGHAVSTATLASLPLEIGSEVATITAPAVLFFQDGSSVRLAPVSRAKLTGSPTLPKLILLSGSLDYKVVLGSNLSVTNLDLERKTKPAGRSVNPAAKPISTPRSDEVTMTTDSR